MQPSRQIPVLALGMDERGRAILRMAFRLHKVHRYVLGDDRPDLEPALAIVDVDGVDGMRTWDDFRAVHPALPALLASVRPPPEAPAPVLTKPVRVETLFPLLRGLLDGQPAAAAGAAVAASPPAAAAPPWPQAIEHFDPRQGLLGTLHAIRDDGAQRMVTVNGDDGIIVLPRQNRVALLHGMAQVREACAGAAEVGSRPLRREDKPQPGTVEVLGLNELLWQVALWTSGGRLPHGLDADAPLRLRHWPNLTRLAPIPNALRIAAFLTRAPAPLRLLVRMLNVPPADAFTFVAAAHGIGLLETGEPRGAPRPEPGGAALQAPRRSLLSRLLRKVVGL